MNGNYAWHSGNTDGHPLFEGVWDIGYNMLFVKGLLMSNKGVEKIFYIVGMFVSLFEVVLLY